MGELIIDNSILAMALRNVNEGICITDLNDKLLYTNSAFLQMYGYEEPELIGQSITLLRGPGNPDEITGEILPLTTGQGVWRGELINKRKDGSLFEVKVTTSLINDESGRPFAVLGVTSDISMQRQAEKALRESEERYRMTADLTGQLIYDYRIDTGEIAWFGAVHVLLGYTTEEINSGGITLWNELIHPDDRAEILRQLDQSIESSSHFHAEYRFQTKNGDYRYFQDTGVFISDPSGRPWRMLGSMNDITHQKLMHSKTRAVAELFRNLGTDTTQNIRAIVSLACEVIGGIASLFNRLDDERFSLVVWAGHNLPDDFPHEDPPTGHICYEATMKSSGRPVVLGNLTGSTYEDTDPNVKQYGLKAYLGAPVMIGSKIIGALAVVDHKPRIFTQDEIDLITILARALSLEEERLEANTLLTAAIEQSPSGILIADAPHVTIRIANSQAYMILTGETIPVGMLGHNLHLKRSWKSFHSDGRHYPVNELPLTRAIEKGEITTNEEIIIENAAGGKYVVLTNAAPIRNRSGVVTSAIVIFHDITSRRLAEESLREKARDLERFNNLMIGRELRMIELKKEVNDLLQKLSLPERYTIHEAIGDEFC